jgi:hypothetical protein
VQLVSQDDCACSGCVVVPMHYKTRVCVYKEIVRDASASMLLQLDVSMLNERTARRTGGNHSQSVRTTVRAAVARRASVRES